MVLANMELSLAAEWRSPLDAFLSNLFSELFRFASPITELFISRCTSAVNLPGDSTMEILLLEIGDIGKGRLAGGVFAKVVSNPILLGLALNLHLRCDAGVAANVSSDEVDGIKPDLESTDLLIVPFPFSTVTENIDSPYSRSYHPP